MKILILYTIADKKQIRKTINDHLYSFSRYLKNVDIHYCNTFRTLPKYLKLVKYDAIILHYTFLGFKWNPALTQRVVPGMGVLKELQGHKIAIPQDEYVYSNVLCDFFLKHGVETVFTCAQPCDYQTLYPREKSGLKYYFTVFTGYVDEETQNKIEEFSKQIHQRSIDIGYRARDLPYWLGYFGQIKPLVGERANRRSVPSLSGKQLSLVSSNDAAG